jgi:hypothetical protein
MEVPSMPAPNATGMVLLERLMVFLTKGNDYE